MCDVCGCGDPKKVTIDVHASLLSDNDREALHLRQHFVADGVLALNVMGSPGSGKTALVEALALALAGRLQLAAVSGDLATTLDAERLSKAGVTAATITTGSACHLDASLVHNALHGDFASSVAACDVFFIENVGNLVCPAIYDLGQAANVVVLSVTEGVDKPLKYPDMFAAATLMVFNKIDLLPHVDFDVAKCIEYARRVNPGIAVLQLSATRGDGMDAWLDWLLREDAVLQDRS